MRTGLVLPEADAAAISAIADAVGLAAVLVPDGVDAVALTADVAVATTWTRIIVPVVLGTEHPITLAEEIAVLDQLSGGRIVALVHAGELAMADAADDLRLLREAWSSRWILQAGPPSTVSADASPASIAVTPSPAQLELPVWLDGALAPALSAQTGLPVLGRTGRPPTPVDRARPAPVVLRLSGHLDDDRRRMTDAVVAGASIALVEMDALDASVIEQHIARHLAPEAAMPAFPRIIAESGWPRPTG